jgi:hypothetical protein
MMHGWTQLAEARVRIDEEYPYWREELPGASSSAFAPRSFAAVK